MALPLALLVTACWHRPLAWAPPGAMVSPPRPPRHSPPSPSIKDLVDEWLWGCEAVQCQVGAEHGRWECTCTTTARRMPQSD